MEVTRVKFYTNGNIRKEKGELKYCSVTFDNGVELNDIILKSYNDELVVMLPRRSAIRVGIDERYFYQIVSCGSELYHKIKQAILEQWQRYIPKTT